MRKYLGYLWGVLKAIWLLKGLWLHFATIAADAGNAWTDGCLDRAEWDRMAEDGWLIMCEGGFTCPPIRLQDEQRGQS